MITTAAAPNLAWCHERMPGMNHRPVIRHLLSSADLALAVILDEAGIEIWLRTGKYSSEEALAQLKPDPGLEWYPVPSLGTRQVTHKVTLVGFSSLTCQVVSCCVWCMQSAT